MTTNQIARLVTAWIAQSYPSGRVPTGLLRRSLSDAAPVEREQLEAAVRFNIDRGLLNDHGPSPDGRVVSLTQLGREQGEALLESLDGPPQVGKFGSAAEELLSELTTLFAKTLRQTAIEWASQAGSEVEPLHIILAAKSLTAGALSAAIADVDASRDKSRDGEAEERLLKLLWRDDQGGRK